MTKTIEDKVKESKEVISKLAKNTAMIGGVASLIWYGNSAFQSLTEKGNFQLAIVDALVGTLCAINAAVNYKTYRDYKEQQL